MKMVKCLLLGSAAGLVAVAGVQAADLPVKAKPVEYVKVCSLYGVGFYYIPGTDICLKVGGYVRAEFSDMYGASMTNGPFSIGALAAPATFSGNTNSGIQTRTDGHDFLMRTRAYASFDSRQQTQYGTLRSYLLVGTNFDSPQAGNVQVLSINRGFVQLAGFTVGLASSYFDFYSIPATSYFGPPASDTGDGGWKVAAYTAQFGNGWTATLSFEEPRRSTVGNASIASMMPIGLLPVADMVKIRYPDTVANLRVDQAWGSWQLMGALHDASAGYYSLAGAYAGSEISGHPSDKMGWAAAMGFRINTPFITAGDYFQLQIGVSQGASRYIYHTTQGATSMAAVSGATYGYGVVSDGIFCGNAAAAGGVIAATATCPAGGSAVQLTSVWGVNAAYEHFWTAAVRSSVYGWYNRTTYNAASNAMMCANAGAAAAQLVFTAATAAACNNNWSWWGLGSRSQWDITKLMYIGVDVLYQKLNTASAGTTATFGVAPGAVPGAATGSLFNAANQESIAVRVRWHRDLYL